MGTTKPSKNFQTKVVNIRHGEPYDVYIGRGSPFGNPFKIGKDADRDAVVESYRHYFLTKLHLDADFTQKVIALRGKRLGCYCAPERCHGEVIAELLDAGYIDGVSPEEYREAKS